LQISRLEVLSVGTAVFAVLISVVVAVQQSRQTREALSESRIQNRVSSCTDLGAYYADQSWRYKPIPPKDFEENGLPADTEYEEKGANQVLEIYSGLAIAAARALQLCLVENETHQAVRKCITSQVDTNPKLKVKDDRQNSKSDVSLIC